MQVYLEHLYHYQCDHCKKWWTLSHLEPNKGDKFFCPHCDNLNIVDNVTEHLRGQELRKIIRDLTG